MQRSLPMPHASMSLLAPALPVAHQRSHSTSHAKLHATAPAPLGVRCIRLKRLSVSFRHRHRKDDLAKSDRLG